MKYTDTELSAIYNAKVLKEKSDEFATNLRAEIQTDMGGFWADAPGVLAVLATSFARLWQGNGVRINALLQVYLLEGKTLQEAWALLPTPPRIIAALADGSGRDTGVTFPTANPLTVWAVPVADEAAALALIAQGEAAVTAALMAANA